MTIRSNRNLREHHVTTTIQRLLALTSNLESVKSIPLFIETGQIAQKNPTGSHRSHWQETACISYILVRRVSSYENPVFGLHKHAADGGEFVTMKNECPIQRSSKRVCVLHRTTMLLA